jgi:hypothetical protein
MKTWGENPIIQEIRDRLRILKKEAVYPWRVDYGSGYRSGIDDALKAIAKVMKNRARVKNKKGNHPIIISRYTDERGRV